MTKKNVSAANDITVITGLSGSGKSTYVDNHYLRNPKGVTVVIDPQKEYLPNNKYGVMRLRDYSRADEEFETLAAYLVKDENIGKIDTLIVDESNVVLPKLRLKPHARKLINTLRHCKLKLVLVARRPTDVNLLASELSSHRIIFRATGKNDIDYLNDIEKGLGDAAFALGAHDYLDYRPGYGWKVHKGK